MLSKQVSNILLCVYMHVTALYDENYCDDDMDTVPCRCYVGVLNAFRDLRSDGRQAIPTDILDRNRHLHGVVYPTDGLHP